MFKANNESLTFDIKKMISNDDIIGLDLTTDFETLKSFIEYYSKRFNGIKTENNYPLLFQPNGTVAVLKSL